MGVNGIRQSVFAARNTLLTVSPVNLISPGLSSSVNHEWEDVPVKDYREADLPDKVRHTFSVTSKQIKLWELNAMKQFGLDGADLQVVNEKENSWSATGGVFNYSGNTRFMGFNFRYLLSGKDRSATMNFKVSLDVEEHIALLQDSLVASAMNLEAASLGKRGQQPAEYRAPKFVKIENPSGTSLVNGFELFERSLTIEQVNGETLEYDRDHLSKVRVTLMLKTKKSDGLEVLNEFTKSRYGQIVVEERISTSVIERFNFGEGVLWRAHKYENKQDSKTITLTFTRTVAPYDIVINSGAQTLTINE